MSDSSRAVSTPTASAKHGAQSRGLSALHWLVLTVSASLTLAAWFITNGHLEEKQRVLFDHEVAQIVDQISERMGRYEDALWAGVGAIGANPASRMDANQWRVFAERLAIDDKYPGINGVGVIYSVESAELDAFLLEERRLRPDFHIHPPKERGPYLPITLVEPVGPNREAVGLDVAHEPNRLEASLKARDSGTAQMTAPITLAQDAAKTAGFLLFAPYYQGKPETTDARQQAFQGMVYAPFIVSKLLRGALALERRYVGFRLSDAGKTLYDENQPSNDDFEAEPLLTAERSLSLYGRTWHFAFRSGKAFRQATTTHLSTTILVGGIVIDALLFFLFLGLARSNAHLAREIDERMRAEVLLLASQNQLEARVEERTAELARANSDLRQFTTAASHDLKAPVHALEQLASWLQEDYAEALGEEGRALVDKLRGRVRRLGALLDSLASLHRVQNTQHAPRWVATRALVAELVEGLALPEAFTVALAPDLPDLWTRPGAVAIVFQNLIANAVRHHDREIGSVSVTASRNGESVRFVVEDDGPGIAAQYQERVFEPFVTLRARDEVEGSGMGLALVRRQIEALGGRVSIESAGRGTRVVVDWPQSDAPRAEQGAEDAAPASA